MIPCPHLGLASNTFLATPEGRADWDSILARHGFPTHVCDAPNTGISGFNLSPANQVRRGAAEIPFQLNLAVWNYRHVWTR